MIALSSHKGLKSLKYLLFDPLQKMFALIKTIILILTLLGDILPEH